MSIEIPRTTITKDTAAFLTHLNYVKRLRSILESCKITVGTKSKFQFNETKINNFYIKHLSTHKSIKLDYDLSKADENISGVMIYWLPIKCYYSLYYLESIFIHLATQSECGFEQKGHTKVRNCIHSKVGSLFKFSNEEFNKVFSVSEIDSFPTNQRNAAGPNFYKYSTCTNSLLRLLRKYKFGKKNVKNGTLHLSDFFLEYRMKLNYHNQDYLSKENISTKIMQQYVTEYATAYKLYKELLITGIKELGFDLEVV